MKFHAELYSALEDAYIIAFHSSKNVFHAFLLLNALLQLISTLLFMCQMQNT
jgi:DNA-binding GntR family transcriptional regulator